MQSFYLNYFWYTLFVNLIVRFTVPSFMLGYLFIVKIVLHPIIQNKYEKKAHLIKRHGRDKMKDSLVNYGTKTDDEDN